MRNMSFMLTTWQVRQRTKTVTRRCGWNDLTAGTILCAVEKSQGLGKGGKLKRLAVIRVTEVRREELQAITDSDVIAEGFPNLTAPEFITFFIDSHKHCAPDTVVTVIRFEYLHVFGSVHQLPCGHWQSVVWIQPDPAVDELVGEWHAEGFDTAREAMDMHFQNFPFAKCLDATDSKKYDAAVLGGVA